jgi:hypothetical protein
MGRRIVTVILSILILSVGIIGYSSLTQSSQAQPIRGGFPTICERMPWLCTTINPVITDPCILRPWECIGVTNSPLILPPGCLCPIIDVAKLNVNESVILTPIGDSLIMTKMPTKNISEGLNAQMNRTNMTGNLSRVQ